MEFKTYFKYADLITSKYGPYSSYVFCFSKAFFMFCIYGIDPTASVPHTFESQSPKRATGTFLTEEEENSCIFERPQVFLFFKYTNTLPCLANFPATLEKNPLSFCASKPHQPLYRHWNLTEMAQWQFFTNVNRTRKLLYWVIGGTCFFCLIPRK